MAINICHASHNNINMDETLTFKQYLEGKHQLLQAIANTPTSVIEYDIKKYCSIPLSESDDNTNKLVGLRPKDKLVVEWCYTNPTNPSPTAIRVVGSKTLNDDTEWVTEWTGVKLQRWLSRYASQGVNCGCKI